MNTEVLVKIKKLDDKAVIPQYSKPGDAGMDIVATKYEYDEVYDNFVYHTGLSFELPEGYVMLIFPRSSNSKTESYLTNHVGVLDSGYRGELIVKFKSRVSDIEMEILGELQDDMECLTGRDSFTKIESVYDKLIPYKEGDRICQIMILPYPRVNFSVVDELSKTERGEGGFGSTGK